MVNNLSQKFGEYSQKWNLDALHPLEIPVMTESGRFEIIKKNEKD